MRVIPLKSRSLITGATEAGSHDYPLPTPVSAPAPVVEPAPLPTPAVEPAPLPTWVQLNALYRKET